MFLIEKEFDQMKMENKQLQMENKRLRERISDINQTVEELKREKDSRVLTNGNQPDVSSSGIDKRLLLNAGNISLKNENCILSCFSSSLSIRSSILYLISFELSSLIAF